MNAISKIAMPKSRKHFYEIAQKQNPWLPTFDVPEMLKKAKPIIDRHPRGEAPITVGSVIHHWDEAVSDGIVIVGPWGCGPALIAESLLRHQRQIPMLFVYNDGAPLDERKLNGFVFRLHRHESKRRQRPAGKPISAIVFS